MKISIESAAQVCNAALKKTLTRTVAAGVLLVVPVTQLWAADLSLQLTNIASDKGKIQIAIYDSKEEFNKTPVKLKEAMAVKGSMTITIEGLVEGEYAVMLFHDKNDNSKFDTNFLGMPKEDWGASLQGRKVKGAPGWDDVNFMLPADGLTLDIKL